MQQVICALDIIQRHKEAYEYKLRDFVAFTPQKSILRPACNFIRKITLKTICCIEIEESKSGLTCDHLIGIELEPYDHERRLTTYNGIIELFVILISNERFDILVKSKLFLSLRKSTNVCLFILSHMAKEIIYHSIR